MADHEQNWFRRRYNELRGRVNQQEGSARSTARRSSPHPRRNVPSPTPPTTSVSRTLWRRRQRATDDQRRSRTTATNFSSPSPNPLASPAVSAPSSPLRNSRQPAATLAASIPAVWQVLATAVMQLSITISSMNPGFECMILIYFGLELREHLSPHDDPDCRILANKVDSDEWPARIETARKRKMHWSTGKSEDQSSPEYHTHLVQLLDDIAPGQYTPILADKHKQLLTSISQFKDNGAPMLPFTLRGTTDVLICPNPSPSIAALVGAPTKQPPRSIGDIRVVLQLKKSTFKEYEHCVCQSTGELFASDLKASGSVIAVLTDLNDDWTFQWLTREADGKQVLHRVRFKAKMDGLVALASVLKYSQGDLVALGCVKVEALNVANTNGIGAAGSTVASSLPVELRSEEETKSNETT